ncbi:MAG: DUF4955 domain-containing protein [Spirochaetes bacterium]|nr:DUF4955 domain-containing protein [Spirochaetota bacterium]
MKTFHWLAPLLIAWAFPNPYPEADLVLPAETRGKIEALATGTARCTGLATALKACPPQLLGQTTVAVGRGKSDLAFAGYSLALKSPAAVYLFAARVGEVELPEPWIATGFTAAWSLGKGGLSDSIYRAVFQAGPVRIPGHPGLEGGRFAIPHLLVIVPLDGDRFDTLIPPGVRQSWPAAPSTAAKPSAAFDAFARAKVKGQDLLLPDFSYAGYDHGRSLPEARGRRFPVTDFGAKPDDLADDGEAIQRTIAAAEGAGGGVVFFPRGRYLVNARMDLRKTLYIRRGGIVLKGEGCGEGGSIIHQIHPFETGVGPMDPRHYHLGDTVFYAQSPAEEAPLTGRPTLAEVTGTLAENPLALRVSDPRSLKKGGYFFLMNENIEVLLAMIAPHEPDADWLNFRKSPMTGEIHQIRGIEGDLVYLEEPLRYPVKAGAGWVLKPHAPIAELGFEDLAFMGNAHNRVVHHRNDLEDSGWSPLKMKGVANAWVRRCSFTDVSQTVSVNLSSSVSMLNLFILGNPGHHIPRVNYYTHGVLGGLMDDRAHFIHGPSVSQKAVGTVFWRCQIGPEEPLDSHSGRPFLSLYDRIDGGSLYGSTGGLRDFPQHLGKMVVWNLDHGRKKDGPSGPTYDFWKNDGADVFYNPIIVGLHGQRARFNEDHLECLESLGSAVTPDSLYEAQLALRLGAPPPWVAEAKADQTRLASGAFPAHFERSSPGAVPFLVPETFFVKALLEFVTAKAMRVWGTESNAFVMGDEKLSVTADQTYLRHGLYAGLAALYAIERRGHVIRVSTIAKGPGKAIVFEMGAEETKRPPGFERSPDVADFFAYAKAIGGMAAISEEGPGLRLEIPK